MNPLRLGVNIDHIATVRQARGGRYPDPIQAAIESEQAGADGITLHLREDRRHIQDRDVFLLKDILQTPMNLEMANTSEMVEIACRVKPAYCCLVPEKREELTTEGGLDIAGQLPRIQETCHTLMKEHIRVSLFIDADKNQIDAASASGAGYIELHTGTYADASLENQPKEYSKIKEMAEYAHAKGLIVNAGHGLNYQNVQTIASIDVLHELNIGHAIVGRALFVGLSEAVKEMKRLMMTFRRGE